MTKKTKVLLIRFSAMGDVAMTVPVVASFLKQYPEIKVDFLSIKAYADLFYGLDRLEFIGVNLAEYSGLIGLFRLFKQLKGNNYTHIIDLHDVLRSQVLRTLFRFCGCKIAVIDKGRSEKRALTSQKNKKLIQLKSGFERYADTFRSMGWPLNVRFKSLALPPINPAVSILLGKHHQKRIGIAPFAQHSSKIYPLEKMHKLMLNLCKLGHQIYLFSGRKEQAEMEQWAQTVPNCQYVAGKLSLLDELVLISQLDLMLSMDSANMHLASLVNTRVISVWGATHPYAGFRAWGQHENDEIQVNLECRPCSVYGNKACWRKDFACMEQLDQQEIIDRIQKVLSQ